MLRVGSTEPRVLALGSSEGSLVVAWDSGDARSMASADGRVLCRVPHDERELLRFVAGLGPRFAMLSVARGGVADEVVVEGCGRGGDVVTSRFVVPRIDSLRRAASTSELVIATSPANGAVSLTRIGERAETWVATTRTIDVDDELSREVVSVALDADRYAVLYRRGTPEDAAGAVVLATERGTFAIDALHDIALLESMERVGDVISIVASFEFDRPRELRFDADGVGIDSRRLERGAARATGATRTRADVEPSPGAVVVSVRDLGGDVLATRRIERATGEALPVVARDGLGFAVAFTTHSDEGWAVRVVRLSAEGDLR